jgi:1-deoxy-D-xylulose-5-phosphate synthase
MLYTAFKLDTPAAVRYPGGSGPGVAVAAPTALPVRARAADDVAADEPIAILSFGLLASALGAAEARRHRREHALRQAARHRSRPPRADHDMLVTIEENVVAGGAGSAVGETLAAHGILIPLLQLGLPDAFVDHGDPAQLLAGCGLDVPGVVVSVNSRFGQRRTDPLAKPAA